MSARRCRSERHEQISDTALSLLRRCGETVTDLAASLGQDRTNVSAKIHGSRLWTVDDLDLIADHFGISLPELLAGTRAALDALPRERRASAESRTALPAA